MAFRRYLKLACLQVIAEARVESSRGLLGFFATTLLKLI